MKTTTSTTISSKSFSKNFLPATLLICLLLFIMSCSTDTAGASASPQPSLPQTFQLSDFTVNDSDSPPAITNTDPTRFSISVSNTSTNAITTMTVSFYRSVDDTISTSDTFVTNVTASLGSMSNMTVTNNITFTDIPNRVYFGACVSAAEFRTECSDPVVASFNNGTRDSSRDFDLDSDNLNPNGMFSDGTTLWVSDVDDNKIYAYDLANGSRDASQDFDTLAAAGNNDPFGLWSDGTNMWVVNFTSGGSIKIYAYDLATKERDESKDFNDLTNAGTGNDIPTGLWSDGTTIWVSDFNDNKIYAYGLANKTRDASKDFDTLNAAGNTAPVDLWSDGTTMWVSDTNRYKIYAYDLSSKNRDVSKEPGSLLDAGETIRPTGIWSDGNTMWVSAASFNKVYTYNLQK